MEVIDVRNWFVDLLNEEDFVTDKNGGRVLEMTGASFTVTENTIFGKLNEDYIRREIAWYDSKKLNVGHLEAPIPEIWKQIADRDGFVNSNYGYLIYDINNNFQYDHVKNELLKNRDSRRAVMIYTRPSMWQDYQKFARNDFVCTNAVQYVIRKEKLHAIVQMRSIDVVFGFRNDLAWQQEVLRRLAADLEVETGDITWQVGSLHVYERHFYLIDHYMKTGEFDITADEYRTLYPKQTYLPKEKK